MAGFRDMAAQLGIQDDQLVPVPGKPGQWMRASDLGRVITPTPQVPLAQIQAENEVARGQVRGDYDTRFGSWTPQEVYQALIAYGFKPEEAMQVARFIPVRTETNVPRGGGYFPGLNPEGTPGGYITVNTDRRQPVDDPNIPFTLQHEAEHAYDFNRFGRQPIPSSVSANSWRPNASGRGGQWSQDQEAEADLRALSQNQEYPTAAFIARQVLEDPNGPIPAKDFGHLNHYLIDRLNFDYTQLPPDYREKWFPYAENEWAPAGQERAQSTESDQMARTSREADRPQPDESWKQMVANEEAQTGPQGAPFERSSIREPVALELLQLAYSQIPDDLEVGDEFGGIPAPTTRALRGTAQASDFNWRVGEESQAPTSTVSADQGPYPGALPTAMEGTDPNADVVINVEPEGDFGGAGDWSQGQF